MIVELEINGYRLLNGLTADFGELTVVIGANATGKSSLIDCLELISFCAEYPLTASLDSHGGFSSISTAFEEHKQLTWKLTFEKPLFDPFGWGGAIADNIHYVYEATIVKDREDQPSPAYECLRIDEPRPGYDQPFKFLEATPNKCMIFDREERGLVAFDQTISPPLPNLPLEVQQSESNDLPHESPQPSTIERSLRLSHMRFFNEYPIPSGARALISSFAFYTGFDVGRFSDLRMKPAEIKPITTLLSTGANLGTVLHEILTRAAYRAMANDLREFLRSAYPSFDDIFAETTYGTPPKVLVIVREKGMRRDMQLWDLSDGMLRFLCLGAALLNPMPPPFIAVDEPETGLHPRLLPIIADMLKTAAERTRVLVTTHSPDLLNCFALDRIAVMVRDHARISWRRPRDQKSLRKMIESLVGNTVADLHRSGELEAL